MRISLPTHRQDTARGILDFLNYSAHSKLRDCDHDHVFLPLQPLITLPNTRSGLDWQLRSYEFLRSQSSLAQHLASYHIPESNLTVTMSSFQKPEKGDFGEGPVR